MHKKPDIKVFTCQFLDNRKHLIYLCKVTDGGLNKRRILISPLNWGLGHATRLIPLVNSLLQQGHYVMLAGEWPSLRVLSEEFPSLDTVVLNGFRVKLSKGKYQWFSLLKQIPALIRSIRSDHSDAEELVRLKNIDFIISDNRYGFYSKSVHSVIITHQTHPYIGRFFFFLRPLTSLISRMWIRRFNECWIPDDITLKLAGSLVRQVKGIDTTYMGMCSRLMLANKMSNGLDKTEVLVILSGPEPQRTKLEGLLLNQLKEKGLRTVILGARPGMEFRMSDNISIFPHLSATKQKYLIENSGFIICRSGYSTIMDLVYCQRKALLIPTPGQYEQEYLARRMCDQFGFVTIQQDRLKSESVFDWYAQLKDAKCDLKYQEFITPSIT